MEWNHFTHIVCTKAEVYDRYKRAGESCCLTNTCLKKLFFFQTFLIETFHNREVLQLKFTAIARIISIEFAR